MNKYNFIKNDKLTEEGKSAWKVLQIDPSILFPKNRDNFKEDNLTDKVIDTRYYHYESKRKQLLQEI